MNSNQQSKILGAFQLVLRPIVKILFKYGIGYNQFAETAKTAFVDVASTEFGIRGRPTNISRVAVMTGLTRKEVRRIRSKLESGENTIKIRTTPIAQILTRWHSESDFLDKSGRPATLPFAGGAGSFSDLVKRFGGDVPPGAMRTELKRMGQVEEQSDGELTVKSRSLMPADSIDKLETGLVHGAYPLLSTIAYNTLSEQEKGEGFAQFSAYSQNVNGRSRSRLKRVSYDRLSEVASSFDDLFTAYESKDCDELSERKDSVVMVGLYYFEESDKSANYEW